MKQKTKWLIAFGLLAIPIPAFAFISFCFPISLGLLLIILIWPVLLVEFVSVPIGYQGSEMFAFGLAAVAFIAEIVLLFRIGKGTAGGGEAVV